jgi:hypothetical protein
MSSAAAGCPVPETDIQVQARRLTSTSKSVGRNIHAGADASAKRMPPIELPGACRFRHELLDAGISGQKPSYMFDHVEFETAAIACDDALTALESGEAVAAGTKVELDRVIHMLSSLAISEANQGWRVVVDGLISRRLALEAKR